MLALVFLGSCSKGKSPSGPGDGTNINGITFVSIPGNTFQMGDVEGGGSSDEKPVHSVTLTGFEMSVYEITNAQYAKYLNHVLATGDVIVDSTSVKGAKGRTTGRSIFTLRVPPHHIRRTPGAG